MNPGDIYQLRTDEAFEIEIVCETNLTAKRKDLYPPTIIFKPRGGSTLWSLEAQDFDALYKVKHGNQVKS